MNIKEKRVYSLLKESGAFLRGHFLLSSGKHSDGYVQCAKLIMHPERCEEVAKIIKEKLEENKIKVDKVVGPAMGGVIISYEVGRALKVPAIFTERVDGEMKLRRGFEVKKGENVIVVEDVVTTGKSSLETIKVLENQGANVMAIASIVDRTNKDTKLSYPLYSAIKLDVNTYDNDNCDICKENKIPLVKPGSRKKFD